MQQSLSPDDAFNASVLALDCKENVDVSADLFLNEPDYGDGDEEEVWDIRNLFRNGERSLSVLDRVKSISKSLFLPVMNRIAEAQQPIEDEIRGLADHLRL